MEEINCPHCEGDIKHEDNIIYCPKCGFMLNVDWMIKALNTLEKDKINGTKDKEEVEC